MWMQERSRSNPGLCPCRSPSHTTLASRTGSVTKASATRRHGSSTDRSAGQCAVLVHDSEGRASSPPRPRARPPARATKRSCASGPTTRTPGSTTPPGADVFAFTDAGAPQVGRDCTTEDTQFARRGDQVCRVAGSEHNRSTLSKACRASLEPQVYAVMCIRYE